MEPKDQVQIVILAAGKGTRMNSSEPKALTLLGGKTFLKHILDTVANLNLPNPPIIVVGHQSEKVMAAIGEGYVYALQKEQLGTGHAVSVAKDLIPPKTKLVVVIYADQPLVSSTTILGIINKFFEKRPKVIIATAKLPDFLDWRRGVWNFGRILRDPLTGQVKKMVEFKEATTEEQNITEVNAAFFGFNHEWLWQNISKLKDENSKKEYYLTDLVNIATCANEAVETVELENILETLQPNSKEELEILEELIKAK